MRLRAGFAIAVMAAVSILCAAGAAGSAEAATTCTWGGTPAEPTGIFAVDTPLTNLPSTGPVDFTATGALAGDCQGRMTFYGVLDAGATCSEGTFAGTVKGLPGVTRFVGFDAAGVAPSRLYDRAGNLVGSENAQLLTLDNVPFTDCGMDGFTRGTFSSAIELFGDRW